MKWFFLFYLLGLCYSASAEGTKELSPNASIVVEGVRTTDVAAIYIGNGTYGNFAKYNASNAERLQITILDPANECLLLGFSDGRFNKDGINNQATTFKFIVKDPNNKVVYLSDEISESNRHIDSWDEAVTGPKLIAGPNGYDQLVISSAELMSQGWTGAGAYYVEFKRINNNGAFFIPFWDISVANCAGGSFDYRPGRVWSEQWALFSTAVSSSGSVFARPFNGSFYIVAPDELDPGAGFVTKMNFNNSGFRAAAFSVSLNSFGASNSGSIEENRKSIFSKSTIIGEYPVYLNDPVDSYRTADLGTLSILGTEGCLPDNYCFRAICSEIGEIEILIDLHGADKIFTPNSADVLINQKVELADVNVELCIPWDGLDGFGAQYQGVDFDSFTVITTFRQGIYHFPVYDVEINNNGFMLEAARPRGINPKMYYDDANIPFGSGTGSPKSNFVGCQTPCHTWVGDTRFQSYGNENIINSWWYAHTLIDEATVVLKFNKLLDTDISFCAGSSASVGDSVISEPGLYVFNYPTAAGCDSTVIIAIHQVDYASIIDANSIELNCDYPEITLSALSSIPINNISYLWSGPDDQNIQDPTADLISIKRPGIYKLRITEEILGCSGESEIEINQNLSFPTIDTDTEIKLPCKIEDRKLRVSVGSTSGFQSRWTTNDGNIVANANATDVIINRAGVYTLQVKNLDNGCSTFEDVHVVQDTMTYLTIVGEDEQVSDFCATTKLYVQLSSNAYESIEWLPNEALSCEDCLSPELFANKNEDYVLFVTDTNGCVAKKNIRVRLLEDYKLYIPNAFSPNDDGINDKFQIFSAVCGVDIISFSIYNRWGSRLFDRRDFHSTETGNGWNGIFKEKVMPADNYIYKVVIRTHQDDIVYLTGDLQLVR